jgi:spermidine synthase
MVTILFFVSGFPALLYQIVWQRALFTLYGVNIESVTVVVAAFMLGLGAGSLIGGQLSRLLSSILLLFSAIELLIGIYGLASLPLFHWIGSFTAGVSSLQLGVLAFLLVLVPTVLMGATLPLLTHHLVSLSGNVGRAVGALYFANTLGSALACFVAAKVTLPFLGMNGTVLLAAAMNFAVGLSALLMGRRLRFPPSAPRVSLTGPARRLPQISPALSDWGGMVLAGITGLVALSYEIVWYRLYAFSSASEAKTFPYLLGFYLLGIALGSLGVRLLCAAAKEASRHIVFLWLVVVLANVSAFLVPVLMRGVDYGLARWTMPFLIVPSALLGAAFPLVCHLSVLPGKRTGQHLSFLYGANIVGSTVGTFVTGFVLMDRWPLASLLVAVPLAGLAAALVVLLATRLPSRQSLALAVLTLAAMAAIKGFGPGSLDRLYERLQWQGAAVAEIARFHDVVETRSGIVTVTNDGLVFGGGAYDGAFNVDPLNQVNGIFRAYALDALHPAPRRILEIGLSTGSWAQVMANDAQVQQLTSIEINPGYLRLIARRPEVAGLLRNPKVTIHIDDGRRWLARNPAERFDVIVMNTIYHWRASSTHMLSKEFLELAREHLAPGGVVYYNPTGSLEVVRTGLSVFPYALSVSGMLAVSNSPLSFDRARWRKGLGSYCIDGHPVLDPLDQVRQRQLEEILSMAQIDTRGTLEERTRGRRLITDDNTGVEFR